MLNIGNRLECFFDQELLDMNATDAEVRLHQPVRGEVSMVHDAEWEGDMSNYHCILNDDGLYRMYYLGWRYRGNAPVVCYAESRDGIHWVKPVIGTHEFAGSWENNIVLDKTENPEIDNFMVFKDENPLCDPEKRYKATASSGETIDGVHHHGLYLFVSADGINFKREKVITEQGAFDSLNVIFWDKISQKYRCYFRNFHPAPEGTPASPTGNDIRDIRYMESDDFENWSEPVMLRYGDAEDSPLYTNNVQPYYRAPHIFIGIPTRYVERIEWDDSFEELCGKEKRLERMKDCQRYGLVVTDALFMTSRNGVDFKKYDEAWMPPYEENGRNWTYADCYFAYGMIETPSENEGADPEISLYLTGINHWMGIPAELVRYTIRRDGFVSLHAGAKEKVVLTKEFTYDGDSLHVNFATSAKGYMSFTLIDADGNRHESAKHFGNSTCRRIKIGENAIGLNSGKPVRLEIRMREADLYSIRFGE